VSRFPDAVPQICEQVDTLLLGVRHTIEELPNPGEFTFYSGIWAVDEKRPMV
jgi:hypothetical protein